MSVKLNRNSKSEPNIRNPSTLLRSLICQSQKSIGSTNVIHTTSSSTSKKTVGQVHKLFKANTGPPKLPLKNNVPRIDYIRIKPSALSNFSHKPVLDKPEIIKDKAKKLVAALEKCGVRLNDISIERLILGNPNEFIIIFRKIFALYGNTMAILMRASSCCSRNSTMNDTNNGYCNNEYKDFMIKLNGKLNVAVVALLSVIAQTLEYKPIINPGQFLQENRYILPKLTMCTDIIDRMALLSAKRLYSST